MTTDLAPTLTPSDTDRLFQAEALVRSYCGWHIAPVRADTLTPSGWGLWQVILPSLRVESVSVTRDTVDLVADTEFFWDGELTVRFPYSYGPEVTVVTFTHGYEDPPEDVTAVVQALAARAIASPSAASVTSRTIGPFSETYGEATGSPLSLLESDKASLAPYRIVKVK